MGAAIPLPRDVVREPPALVRADLLDAPGAGAVVLRGSVLRGTAYVICILLSVLSVPLMTRHLGVEDYGRFVTVIALIAVVGGLTDAGLTSLGVRELVTSESDGERLLRNLLGLRLVLTSVGLLGAALFVTVAGYSHALIAGTVVAGIGLLLQQYQQTLSIPLSASLRLGWLSALDLVRQVTLVALIAALVAFGASLVPFLAVSVAASGLALAVAAWLTRARGSLRPAFEPAVWKGLGSVVVPYAIATAAGMVCLQVTMIAMSLLDSAEETGHFAAAFRVFEVLVGAGWILAVAALPVVVRAAGHGRPRLRHVVQRLFEASVVLGVGVATLTVVAAPVAIHVVGGADYAPAVTALQILAGAVALSFLTATWGLTLLALHRHAALLVANAAALLVAIAASVMLIPAGHARGAAWAALLSQLTLVAIYVVVLARGPGCLPSSLGIVVRTLLAAALATGLALILPISDVAAVAVAGAAYAALIAALHGLPPEVRHVLRATAASP